MSDNKELYEPDLIYVTDDEYLAEIEDEMEFEQVSDILMAMVEKKYDVEYFEPEQ